MSIYSIDLVVSDFYFRKIRNNLTDFIFDRVQDTSTQIYNSSTTLSMFFRYEGFEWAFYSFDSYLVKVIDDNIYHSNTGKFIWFHRQLPASQQHIVVFATYEIPTNLSLYLELICHFVKSLL